MKKVVEENLSTANIEDCSPNKIYAFKYGKEIYKLQRVDDDEYAFVLLNDSQCWALGKDSFAMAFRKNLSDKIYEFDNLEEFAKWLHGAIKQTEE